MLWGALGTIHNPPSDSPCLDCDPKCDWIHINIPLDNFKATVGDQAELVEAGWDGLFGKQNLTARVVFHNDTTSYPTWSVSKVCVKRLCDLMICPCLEWKTENIRFVCVI